VAVAVPALGFGGLAKDLEAVVVADANAVFDGKS
jgi:hypothetical protein